MSDYDFWAGCHVEGGCNALHRRDLAIERKDAAIAELVGALTDERDAWEDLKSNSVSIDGWLRRFAAQRIGAINKAIAKHDTTKAPT